MQQAAGGDCILVWILSFHDMIVSKLGGLQVKTPLFFFFFCAAFDRWMCEYEMSATESLRLR
jgi:hypothetical protein